MLIQINGKNETVFIDIDRVRFMDHEDGKLYISFGPADSYMIHGVSKNEIERINSLIIAADKTER